MSTDIIFVGLNVYEKNLAKLLVDYETVHTKYIEGLKQNPTSGGKVYLVELESLNKEILALIDEINQNVTKLNSDDKYGKYKDDIIKKKNDLNALNTKLVNDESIIKDLMYDTIDLDGKNETFRLEHKASIYTIFFYIVFLFYLSYLLTRMFSSAEPDPIENKILVLAILVLIYNFWNLIYWGTSVATSKTGTYILSFF